MESLHRSLNYELPHELNFDKYAQQILESSKTILPATTAATLTTTPSADILQKIGATLLNSIQLKKYIKIDNSPAVSSTSAPNMDLVGMHPSNHVVIDSSGFDAMDELQRQVEYDKFMNEVWIGIVLTLILISMVFCFCSCFLYHQFRTWKRNYRSTVTQSQNGQDSEIVKLQPDLEDPVPEYTLVSGLPSYEAALELLNKSPQSCLIVHPSVFSVFHQNEKTSNNTLHQPQHVEITAPLLPSTNNSSSPTITGNAVLPSYAEANNLFLANVTTLTTLNEKTDATATTTTTTTTDIAKCMKVEQSSTLLTAITTSAATTTTKIGTTDFDISDTTQKD